MTPSIKRILFATDLSRNSSYAFRHAVGLAKATGAEIRVLHVCETLSDDAKLTLMMFIQDDVARHEALSRRVEMTRQALAERQESFWKAVPAGDRKLRDQIVAVDVVEGFPAEEILRHATDHDCDLIVLGAHEHAVSHTFLGSVAKRVLRRAKIPSLVVPNRHDDG